MAILAAASWYLLPNFTSMLPQDSGPHLARTLVTTDAVNLRSGPGIEHEVISVVPNGTEVASDYAITNGFTQVEFDGMRGWMSADYLVAPGRTVAQAHAAEMPSQPPEITASASEERSDLIVPDPEPTVAPTYAPVVAQHTEVQTEPQPGEKWIEVNRTTRTVTLHNGEIVVAQYDALIGKDPSAGGYYSTAVGTFYVHVKEKSLVETPFAEGVYLTDFVGFDPDRSNGFHSPVRDADGNVVVTGGTTTLGCVRLAEADAIFLFEFAEIGMRVEVHD